MALPEFVEFPKIARLARNIVVTEKIDGTNGVVHVGADGTVTAGSRSRWLLPDQPDNFGFRAWVTAHADELRTLGEGSHFGEWWGSGIQRGYGLTNGEKRWSVFNVRRWALHGTTPQRIETADPRIEKYQDVLPACVGLVPKLYEGPFHTSEIDICLNALKFEGSRAVPGFMQPEGVVVFHGASGYMLKRTIEKDDEPKSKERR